MEEKLKRGNWKQGNGRGIRVLVNMKQDRSKTTLLY